MDSDGEDQAENDNTEWSLPVDGFTAVDTYVPQNYNCMAKHDQKCINEPQLQVSKLGHKRTIIHIDVDCFYAQVEMIRNPSLRHKPLGIQQKYIVVTCNYKAREYGVTKLMGIKEALEKCPELILVSGEDLTHYREMSYRISEYVQKFTPYVERLGMDENFLDVSSIIEQRQKCKEYNDEVKGHIYGISDPVKGKDVSPCLCGCYTRLLIGSQVASDIRQALYEDLGITCCAGISYNKLLAKLVGEQHKPNQQTTLFPQFSEDFMTKLPKASKVPGIGWTTAKKLAELGVKTVTDLQEFPMCDLKREINESLAVAIKQLSYGIDDNPVTTFGKPQTLSDEDSFKKCSTQRDARCKIRQLLSNLVGRLTEDGRLANTLRVTVRKFVANKKYSNRESRQGQIPSHVISKISTDKKDELISVLEDFAMSLFVKVVDINRPFHLTLINIAFCNLQEKSKNSISNFFSPKKKSETGQTTNLHTYCDQRKGDEENLSHHYNKSTVSSREIKESKDPEICGTSAVRQNIQECGYTSHTRVLDDKKVLKSKVNEETFQRNKRKPEGKGLNFFAKRQKMSSSFTCTKEETSHSLTERYTCAYSERSKRLADLDSFSVDELLYNRANCLKEKDSTLCESGDKVLDKISITNSLQIHDNGERLVGGCKEPQDNCPCEHSELESNLDWLSDEKSVSHTVPDKNISMKSTFTHNSRIPSDIDPEVFNSLPADIQQEVLQQYSQTLSVSNVKPVTKCAVNEVSLKLNKKQKLKDKPKSAGNILNYFKVESKK